MIALMILVLTLFPIDNPWSSALVELETVEITDVQSCEGTEFTLRGVIGMIGAIEREANGGWGMETTTSATLVGVNPTTLDSYRLVIPPRYLPVLGASPNGWSTVTPYHAVPGGYDLFMRRTSQGGQESDVPVLLDVVHDMDGQGNLRVAIENVRVVC